MVNQQFATAVHVLTALAFHKKSLMSSEVLAQSVNTNPVVIRRLLSQLTKAHLVSTTRGKAGGVKLAQEPHMITLKDVYLALSPSDPMAPRDKAAMKECPVSCSMFSIMTHVSEGTQKATMKYLESQKLSDLTKKIQKS